MTASMNITFPEPLRRFVEEQAVQAGYRDSGEYVREVVAREQARHARDGVDAQLLTALDEPFHTTSAADFEALRQRARDRADVRRT